MFHKTGRCSSVAAVAMMFFATALAAQPRLPADLILVNAEVLTMDPGRPTARGLAIRENQIVAIGTDAEVKKLRGPITRVMDLGGRTVIPGIVDTHIHAIRGGQGFSFESYWSEQTTLVGAIDELKREADQRGAGKWVAVVGAWDPEQFAERRMPTVKELSEAIPDNPAYVQYLYNSAVLNEKGIEALGLNSGARLPSGIVVERDGGGKATGKLRGGIGPFNVLVSRISPNTPEQNRRNLAAFFGELNKLGVTGIVDPAAGDFPVYDALFSLWRDKALTVRVAYRASALPSESEFTWFTTTLTFLPPLFGDDMLRFLGVGEVLVFGMNDGVMMGPGFSPSQKARDELFKVAMLAAERAYPLEIHAYTNDGASAILDVFEKVAEKRPIKDLRWAITHISTGTEETFERMRRLGLAYTVQMGPYFEAPAIREANGESVAQTSPPTRLALDKGLMVAGGTDSTRIGVINVWRAIEYHVTGQSAGAAVRRRSDFLLTREEALRLYTANAAWITFDERHRGTLTPGKLADLAVLDAPFLRTPADQIHSIRSVMTIVDGKVVYVDHNALRVPAIAANRLPGRSSTKR